MQMVQPSSIPVVILAGGYGSRLGEYTEKIPKPLVEIGNLPMIVHIMKLWHRAGHREFIIAGGYKYRELAETLFSNDWKDILPNSTISPVDTGVETETGGRLRRLKSLLSRRFALSYGDGVINYPLYQLAPTHVRSSYIASMLVAHPLSRFGEVQFDEIGRVTGFSEKPMLNSWVNAGFFMFEPDIFDYIKSDSDVLEKDVFPPLVKDWNLMAIQHDGWWQCMDTPKDVRTLTDLWNTGKAPWL